MREEGDRLLQLLLWLKGLPLQMLRKKISWGMLCLLTLISGACPAAPVKAPSSPTPSSQDISAKEAALFYAHVADRVRREHAETVANQTLLEGALKGMLSSLDPHSAYLDPKKFQEVQKQAHGEYGGLGIEVVMAEGAVQVVSPLEGTPADKAGLKPGDLIVAIDDESVYGLTIVEASEKLRGAPDTTVKILVRREKKAPFELTLARESIKVIPVKFRREGNVGYLRLTTFNEHTTRAVKEALKHLQQEIGPQRLQGYVIDVRNNPGGLFEEGIEVTDLFLAKGEIVSIQGRGASQKRSFAARKKDFTEGAPLVVLINGGSASSSEILAGALQDHKRALIVGTKSFGKGSIQTVIPMTNGGAIKLTTALYRTPAGRLIQKTGIVPDITVEQQVNLKSLDEGAHYREADLKGALGKKAGASSVEKSQDSKNTDEPGRKKKKPLLKEVVDYQLEQALNILRAVSLHKKMSGVI